MNQKLRVGIVGCGEIAQISHLPYLQELPFFEVKAICDLSPSVLDRLGDMYHIPHRFTDFNDLVKLADIDIVLVTNKNHAAPALAAMNNGKNVFVEKPIAFNLKQADDMILSAKKNEVKLMVGYMKHYDPAFEMMQKYIKSIEKIHLIRVHEFAGTYAINREIYDMVKASDLNKDLLVEVNHQNQLDMLSDIGTSHTELLDAHDIMIHLCIHDINVLHGLYGLPEKIICARLFDGNFVTALMQYKNGVNLVWESGNLTTLTEWDEQITVFGSNQSLELRFPFPYLKNAATILNIRENEGQSASQRQIVTSYDEAFKREWRHFYDCIINNKQPSTGAEEARRDLEFGVELTRKAAGID